MAISRLRALQQFVIREFFKDAPTGVMRTLPNQELVDMNVQVLAQRLMQGGIDPTTLKNANQVENAIKMIESRPPVQQGITSTKSAKVFDMEGQEIPKGSKIMGGKAVKETEAEMAARMRDENKEAIKRFKKKMEEDRDLSIINPNDEIKQAYEKAVKEGKFKGTEEDFRDQIDKMMDDIDSDFAQGGRAGFFMGSKFPKGLATLRDILKYMSKKGQDEDKIPLDLSALDMLRMSNPKAFNKMLEDVRGKVLVREGIMGTDAVKAQQKLLEEKRKDLVEKTLDVAKSMKLNQDEVAKRVNKAVEEELIPNIKAKLMKDMNMSEEAAQKMAESMSRAAAGFKPRDAAPELTEEGIMQLENILKNMKTGGKTGRDLNASGGRIGFKDGMTRRTFLKIFAGLASIPIVGKIVKPLKFAKGVKNPL